jgi:hypothetical protein
VRQLLGRRWSPTSFAQFFAIVSSFTGRPCRLIWMLFAAQSWILWNVRNKHVFESRVISQIANLLYKIVVLLQLWAPLAKHQDSPSILELTKHQNVCTWRWWQVRSSGRPGAQRGRKLGASLHRVPWMDMLVSFPLFFFILMAKLYATAL